MKEALAFSLDGESDLEGFQKQPSEVLYETGCS